MQERTSSNWQNGNTLSSQDTIPPSEVLAELDKILASSTFRNSPRHSRFLSFVVKKVLSGGADQIKEYLIGLEVFDRKPDFDPAADPVVRSEARRLRSRLADYYREAGRLDAIHLDLPKGTYVPVFSKNGLAEPAEQISSADAPSVSAAEAPRPAAGVRARRSPRGWLIAAAVGLAAMAVIGYLALRSPAKLTDKDSIVLADFDNKTGDALFDDTLKQGLSVQLEQSPFLALVSESKVNQILKLMGLTAGDRLTPDIARQICQRTGSTAMLNGSIVPLGSQYVIGLRAVNCNTGDVLAETQVQAKRKEDVLGSLGTAASTLRSKLGESLSSVQKYSTPLVEATTPSLEALKAYSMARKENAEKGDIAALPFYQRAAEIDPNFAMAYRAMSSLYSNQEEPERAAENARKAYELRAKTSERERFSIETAYYMLATGELEKAARIYDLWQKTFPRDSASYGNPGVISASLGRLEKALQQSLAMVRIDPGDVVSYVDLGLCYQYLNRITDTEAVYNEAERRTQAGDYLIEPHYMLAFLKGDKAQMARLVAAAAGKPGIEDALLADQANTEAWYGKMRNARELTQRAMDSAQHNDAMEAAAMYQAVAALREVETGYKSKGQVGAREAVKFGPNRDAQAMAALALARAGDIAAAEKLADELDKKFPLDTLVQRYSLPTIRAAVALRYNDPNRAIELLKPAQAIELGGAGYLLPVYVRGEAYLMLHDGKAAAAEFQKFIDHWGLVGNCPWGALARLGLARTYALDAATNPSALGKARESYQDFFTLWKNADPDIPILKQAKDEYARLR